MSRRTSRAAADIAEYYHLLGVPPTTAYHKQTSLLDADQIMMISRDLIKTEGLPPGLSNHKYEELMLKHGSLYYTVCDEGVFILPYESKTMDIYGEPADITPVPINGTFSQLTNVYQNSGFIIRDNPLSKPLWPIIKRYIERMDNIVNTIVVCEALCKTPFFILADPDHKEDINRILQRIQQGDMYIPIAPGFDINSFQVQNNSMQIQTIEVLWDDYNRVKNELYQCLGIPFNPSSGKRERLIVPEISIEYTSTFALINSRINTRQEAYDIINQNGFKISQTQRYSVAAQIAAATAMQANNDLVDKGGDDNDK